MDQKMEVIDDKDMLIQILTNQRNSLMDQLTALALQVQKMQPYMPKEPVPNDDKPQQ